jgi:hypothetical protein
MTPLTPRERRMLEALKAIQWGVHARCPSCAGWNMGPNGETDREHTPRCIVGLAISEAERAQEEQ